jgi:leucyl aminopeptidase
MRKIILLLFVTVSLQAQITGNERFYATMALHDAEELQQDFPKEVRIIAKKGNEVAVYLTEHAGHKLHNRVLVHGPGFIYKASKEAALASLQRSPKNTRIALDFTITEDALVQEAMNAVNTQNIADHIEELEDYGSRYHSTASGRQAALDLKANWEALAADYGRTDVSVRLYNHSATNMPSVIMTIEGAEFPDEIIVIGGHLDSTSFEPTTNAPGADDDASGIATITEATRTLFEIDFVPKRTIEVMAYAAEEIGLVGSAEIAEAYSNNNIDVAAVAQFDMTLFNGSATDISFITDFTNATLNNYMMQLLDHYNSTGTHAITYSTSLCNYGCSDHASWTAEGYMSTFPFEANFGDHNSAIHTPGDTFDLAGNADHSAKFAKLGAAFLIEASKSNGALGLDEATLNAVTVSYTTGQIQYAFIGNTIQFAEVVLYDILGKKIMTQDIVSQIGTLSVSSLQTGLYIASFITEGRGAVSKKVLIKN